MASIPEGLVERVRAVIIDSGKILLVNRVKEDESYWVIPGGKVEPNESHEKAVRRECAEELGVEVRMSKLLLQRISDKPGTEGQQEFFYLCDIIGGRVGSGQGPEFEPGTKYEGQYRISWVDLKELRNINLKPQEVIDKIAKEYLNK